jgi:hypothetical protein
MNYLRKRFCDTGPSLDIKATDVYNLKQQKVLVETVIQKSRTPPSLPWAQGYKTFYVCNL